jgi:LPS sulfotransferase NodH
VADTVTRYFFYEDMQTGKSLTSKKNIMELSSGRDFPESSPPGMKYLILGSPRSGSTLVSRMLFETGMAGDPLEFFNRHLLELERRTKGPHDLTFEGFLERMIRRRTSPNGVFGMQLHYSQLLAKFSCNRLHHSMIDFVGAFDRHIWLRRRNRLRQAISFAIASKSGAWSSEDEAKVRTLESGDISLPEILSALSLVALNDYGWELLVRTANLQVHEVWYEDLDADYESVSRGILDFLQIMRHVGKVPAPPISRQGSQLNERVLADVRGWLGLDEA